MVVVLLALSALAVVLAFTLQDGTAIGIAVGGLAVVVAVLASGFVVVNPNKPPPPPLALPTLPMSPGAGAAGRPPGPPPTPGAGLDTDVARRVTAVLDREVNPSIASHGGHAELASIEGATAYLRLGGGCQGCGMATVTLSQGIEVAITQTVSEIDRVVDVTDHASGANPYFEPAKK